MGTPPQPEDRRPRIARVGDAGDWGSGNLVPGSALDAPVLALDLGASRLRAALVGPDGTILSRAEAPSATERGPAAVIASAEQLLTSLGAGVPSDGGSDHVMRGGVGPGGVEPGEVETGRTTRGDTMRGDAPGTGSFALRPTSIAPRPIAIGISAIGPVDPRTGLIVDPPNAHPTFRDVPIAEELGRRLGLPAFLDRDTNVALLGELAYGAAQGVADVVYLTVSTGIGGAVLSDGVLLHGPDGTAGELGHLLVDLDGPPCGCGARGHLEAIASGAAIARAAREAVCSGESPCCARWRIEPARSTCPRPTWPLRKRPETPGRRRSWSARAGPLLPRWSSSSTSSTRPWWLSVDRSPVHRAIDSSGPHGTL